MKNGDVSKKSKTKYIWIALAVLVLLGLNRHAMRTQTGIEGMVHKASCATEPCAQSLNAIDIVVTKNNREVGRVRPDTNDYYRIGLSPGRYEVRIDDAGPDTDYASYNVQVERGKFSRQDLTLEQR